MQVHMRIRRFNPEKDSVPWWGDYTIQDVRPNDSVLDVLHRVKWEQDGTLALRRSCAHGVCGSDAVRINGANALACKTLVARLANSPDWQKVISDHYDAVARQYIGEFCRSLSKVDEEVVFQAFSFMVGAMLGLVAEPGRVENLSARRFVSSDLGRVYANLVPFLVGGFESLPPRR